jgi:hypothetical protein
MKFEFDTDTALGLAAATNGAWGAGLLAKGDAVHDWYGATGLKVSWQDGSTRPASPFGGAHTDHSGARMWLGTPLTHHPSPALSLP